MSTQSPLEGAGKVFTFTKTAVSYFVFLYIVQFIYLMVISMIGRVADGAGAYLDYGLLAVLAVTILSMSSFKENIKLNVNRRLHAEVALAQYAHLSGASDDAGIVHDCFWGTLWSRGFTLMGRIAGFFSVINQPHADFSTAFINVVIALLWCWGCNAIARRWVREQRLDKNGNPIDIDYEILDRPELYRDWARGMSEYWDRLRFNKFLDKQNRRDHDRDRDDSDHDSDDDGDDDDDDDDESPPKRY